MSKKGNRIERRDIFEVDLLSPESRKSIESRGCAIACLGELDSHKRERADEQLCLAIYEFVLDAIEEEAPPPSEVRDRLQRIVEQAKKLDEMITGERREDSPTEPLPAIRNALAAQFIRETDEANLAGVSVDGITYLDDAPVAAAIEGIRALERWVSIALPVIEQRVRKKAGGAQSGASKHAFLSELGVIFSEAKDQRPSLSYDDSGGARGEFADFVEEALEALLVSVETPFYAAAPKIHQSIVDLVDSRGALYKALHRYVDILQDRKKPKRSRKTTEGKI